MVEHVCWEIYHTPENLVLFLAGEASELGDFCQWLSKEKIEELGLKSNICEELSDIIKNVIYLANVLPLKTSLETLVLEKLKYDNKEYPKDKFLQTSRFEVLSKERIRNKVPPLPGKTMSKPPTIANLQERAWAFVQDRNWESFYTPASLSLAIAVKTGQVATSYQRRPKPIKSPYARMVWSLADILLNAMRLFSLFSVTDIYERVAGKMAEDDKRFANQ